MGQNKAQRAAAARAKANTEVQPLTEQQTEKLATDTAAAIAKTNTATPTAQPATQPATQTKQNQTIELLKAGWTGKGVNLDKLQILDDGKFKKLIVDAGWPTVQIGPTGGITVVELKSYQKAYDAALIGKELFDKQKAREAKRTASSQPATQQTTAVA